MTETPRTPAGWYPSPDGSGNQRYWDGQQWTDHSAPPSAPFAQPGSTPTTSQQTKGKGCLFWGLIAAAVVVVLLVVGAIAGGGDDDTNSPSDSLKSSTANDSKSGGADSDGSTTSTPAKPKSNQKADSAGAVGSKKNPAARGTAVQNKSAKYQIDNVEVRDSLGSFADKPSGKYVVITLTVQNVKKSTIQISSADFTLNVSGTTIDASDNAYVLDDAFSYDDLSPGLKRTGKIVYDVSPASAGRGVLVAQALLSADEPVYLKLQR